MEILLAFRLECFHIAEPIFHISSVLERQHLYKPIRSSQIAHSMGCFRQLLWDITVIVFLSPEGKVRDQFKTLEWLPLRWRSENYKDFRETRFFSTASFFKHGARPVQARKIFLSYF